MGNGGLREANLELEILSAAMALGEKVEDGGALVLKRRRKEVAGGFDMASTCLGNTEVRASCPCVAERCSRAAARASREMASCFGCCP